MNSVEGWREAGRKREGRRGNARKIDGKKKEKRSGCQSINVQECITKYSTVLRNYHPLEKRQRNRQREGGMERARERDSEMERTGEREKLECTDKAFLPSLDFTIILQYMFN